MFPIERTSGNTIHSGQIGLPGGKYEKSDVDRTTTALRETSEELGVDCDQVEIVGHLTELYIPVSNFKVLPVLGFCEKRPVFRLNRFEVEQVIEMPVQQLLLKDNMRKFELQRADFKIIAPYFEAKGHKIWGATAMILSELRELFLRAGLVR